MSSTIPGHDASAPGSSPRSAPVARISRGALTHNARIVSGRGIRRSAAECMIADAWGHGADVVRDVLAAEGIAPSGAHDEPALDALTLYGLPGGDPAARPALRLTGTVLSVKELRAGEGVSYGYVYRAPRDTRVALVTGGYAQGVVRALGGVAEVSMGERHPIVGRVAMDVCVVEIADASVRRGAEALFLGDPSHDEPSLADWMQATGLHAGELITAVGLRAAREVVP